MCLRWVLSHYNCSNAGYFSVSGAEMAREGKWKEVLLNAENPVLLLPRSIVVFYVKRVQLNKCVTCTPYAASKFFQMCSGITFPLYL